MLESDASNLVWNDEPNENYRAVASCQVTPSETLPLSILKALEKQGDHRLVLSLGRA